MRETFLVAVTHGATKGTTPTVFEHRRRHLLSAGSMPSPMEAARIVCAESASSHFLADGVGAADHHAARSITSPQTSCGLLPNTQLRDARGHVRREPVAPHDVDGHKRVDETMLYVHVAEQHRRAIPESVLRIGAAELDPDQRVVAMLGARGAVSWQQRANESTKPAEICAISAG